MGKINAQKVIFIAILTIGVFYVSLRFYEPILQFMMVPISEAIARGSNVPLMEATALGERFRIALKIALYISSIFIVIIVYKRIAIFFVVGGFVAYSCVLYGVFDVWNNGTVFSMEKYVNHLLIFMIFTGIILSVILRKIAGNNNEK